MTWLNILPRLCGCTAAVRSFSTVKALSARSFEHVVKRKVAKLPPLEIGMPRYLLPKEIPQFPPYPYGESQWFKRSDRGLYGGKMIRTGYKISEFKNRNKRTWKPNVHRHKLWSETLSRFINIKVVSSVLRTINKEGGIDHYLTKDKAARIKELGPTGWKLRYLVLTKRERQTLAEKSKRVPIEEVAGTDGTSKPVYFTIPGEGPEGAAEQKVLVGRRKLAKLAYESLLQSGNQLSYKEFVSLHGKKSAAEILPLLGEKQRLQAIVSN